MPKILIVDDDPDVVDAAKIVLEAEGFEVEAAYNRPEGTAKVGSYSPDLLILDVMMEQPDDGIAMAQDLRQSGCKVPILMLTSISKVTGLEFGKTDGVVPIDTFLEKPVDPSTLVEKVKNLLEKKEA